MQFLPSLLESIQSAPLPLKILTMLLFSAICINQTIKQLSSERVRNFIALCINKAKELGNYLNDLSKIPHLPKEPKPSWLVVVIMSLLSGSAFSYFIILTVIGAFLYTSVSFGELLLLGGSMFGLVFVSRCCYAAAHRERAKLLGLN